MRLGGSGLLSPALAALPLLFLVHLGTAQSPVFLAYPGDVTVALGSTVTLECVADQPSLAWTINSVQLLDPEALQPFLDAGVIKGIGATERVEGGNRTTITINATALANNTINSILCQAGPDEFNLQDGQTVSFTVYGLPLAPGELEVAGDTPHQLRLSWSPPFTLPGETVSYSLLVQDLATGLNQTLAPLSATGHTHQLSEAEALACHLFLFSVFSVNEVGLSLNSSSAPPALHPSAPGQLGPVETEVSHNSSEPAGSRAVLRLIFQKPTSCFQLNFTVRVSREDEVWEVPVEASPAGGSEVIELRGLRENSRYSAVLSASNHFQFSIDSPSTAEVSFVTSGLQSVSVLDYGNGTVRITCSFAPGSLSSGCEVTLTLGSSTTTITINRSEGALEVVRYSLIGGAPSLVEGRELGVQDPLVVSGTLSSEPLPTPTSSETGVNVPTTTGSVNHPVVSTSPVTSSASATPTSDSTTDPSPSTSDLSGLLIWVIPAGVAVAVLALIVLFTCFCVCCRHSSKRMRRRSTLPRGLRVPHSPASPTYSHDYKQVPPHVSGTIKEMSFNPLYGDAPAQTFDPPLPSLPHPANGRDSITLPSNVPPLYEEVSASRRAAKLASNPQYGAVGGANAATPNPQYGSPPRQLAVPVSEEHMYASLKEPSQLSPQQQLSLQYAQPYEHVPSSHAPPPGGVAILTGDNVSYSATPPPSVASQKSL